MEDGSPSQTPAVLDVETLDSLAEQFEEDFDPLVVRFRRRLAETPATIREAWAAGDRVVTAREAHSLKSVAATFGASRVSQTSVELEERAPAGTAADVEGLIGRLDRDCAAAAEAIDGWSSGRAASRGEGPP